ncbi:uncharacterized protein EI97DRAFT_12002 [Westerdykella ornata]|uniref:Uncharacterized protein n=1 Tax=Westerdykella ornata TaxID=318751 RepID=A0A6A6K0N1_WESOR|nr:uncharacterized protein EI97DRAFT_12002 [Westerdykella ornata]KAF2280889.1 hypothetical protein EI97DRAFT_12002 [Westerdykella ornata]
MAANPEKPPVTFGATIEPPCAPTPALRSPPSNDTNASSSPISIPAAAEKEMEIDSSNPFSPFYTHPDARRSWEEKSQTPSQKPSKTNLHVVVMERETTRDDRDDRDLELGSHLSAATTAQQPKVSVDGRVKECTMWPSRQAMLDKKRQNKQARSCSLFRNLSSKQRLWVKIVIGLLIVAAATGLGIGISKAVGGGVWASPGQSRPISSR